MAIFETSTDWDANAEVTTTVSVHSPVIKETPDGQFYTVYSISLKTTNPSFARNTSCVQRRYSEFIFLRNLLVAHHPTMEPPELPPRKYFHRFDQAFINERIEGLLKFLNELLVNSVYLSNRTLHLFLQSTYSMPKILEEVSGEHPTPRLLSSLPSSYDSRSESPSFNMENLIINDVPPETENNIEVGEEAADYNSVIMPPNPPPSQPIPILPEYLRPMSAEGNGSSGSSHWSAGSSPYSSSHRRVSFSDTVQCAHYDESSASWRFRLKNIRD